jgi:hypothetical protein
MSQNIYKLVSEVLFTSGLGTDNRGTSPFCEDDIVFFCSEISTMDQSMNIRHVGHQGHHNIPFAQLCFQQLLGMLVGN